MSLVIVRAPLASTRPIEARYPGWDIAVEALHGMAETLKQGSVPMLFEHDVQQALDGRVIDAEVVPDGESHHRLEVTFEIDEDVWRSVQDRFAQAGSPGGLSYRVTAEQRPSSSGRAPSLTLAADAAAWTDEDRLRAQDFLEAVGPTQVDFLFEFSAVVEVATVVLEIAADVGLGMLGNAVWDALKLLVSARDGNLTRIEIRRTAPDGTESVAVVTTNDPDVVADALKALEEPQKQPVIAYDPKKRLWS